MVRTCRNCKHLCSGGAFCPVCNWPHEDDDERRNRTSHKGQTSDGEDRCRETVETAPAVETEERRG